MQKKQQYVRDTLVNVQHFLDENAAARGPVNTSGARKALEDAVAALTTHAVGQGEHTMGSTGETSKQRTLRLALRKEYLQPIARVARAKLSEVAEFSSLRMPRGNVVGSEFVDAAESMANAAEPYAATFTAAGLKPDFLDGLRALAQQLSASLGGRTDHVQKRRGSTIALAAAESDSRKAIKLLDAVIQQQVPGNTQLLAEWDAVKHIPKKPVLTSTGQAAAAKPVAPVPATAPAAASTTRVPSTAPAATTPPVSIAA